MNEYSTEHNLDIIAYCLMTNHVHFIAIPPKEETLSKVFNTVHMRYAHYLNRQRKVKGHLWQGRFYSCALDDAHLYRAIRSLLKKGHSYFALTQLWKLLGNR